MQARRYGGDLQGVLDRLDYLQELGVTALYLNPVNDAPSLHKYDARNYHHIDRNFGPDPRGDERRIAAEHPADPATWGWTAGDSLFLELVREVHRRKMRIIVDYSWNHTGIAFWAWQDVLKRQRESPYADWYAVEAFDDPATPDTNEFRYRGWVGVPWLPEWKKIGRPDGQTHGAIEGTLVPGVRKLVFDVTRRWLDPNGDGDPSEGVDGFRLDVAEMVPLGFWREYRRFVRSINPEAYLVGEVWWESWPDRIYDPAPWLQGDVFDAVMNYRWFMPTRGFFSGAPPALSPPAYAASPGLAGDRDSAGAHEGDDEPDREPRHTAIRDLDLQSEAGTSTTTTRARIRTTASISRMRAPGPSRSSSWCSSSPTSERRTSGTGTRWECGAPTIRTIESHWCGPILSTRTRRPIRSDGRAARTRWRRTPHCSGGTRISSDSGSSTSGCSGTGICGG